MNIRKSALVSLCVITMGTSVALSGCGSTETGESDETVQATLAVYTLPDEVDAELGNVKYDAALGAITGTVTNNGSKRIDHITIDGTIKIAKQDNYGNPIDDPVDIHQYFANNNITYATRKLAIDIPANATRDFTLTLSDLGTGLQYQRNMTTPELYLRDVVLRDVGDDVESGEDYYADSSEYTIGAFDIDTSKENKVTVTVTNNSSYRWKNVVISYSYINESGEKKYSYADGNYVDIGSTVELTHFLQEEGRDFTVDHVRFDVDK